MNRFKINTLGFAVFAIAVGFTPQTQAQSAGENYYSNPRMGIHATPPAAYSTDAVSNKSEDITVQLVGEVGDTIVPTDSIKGTFNSNDYYDYEYSARINRFHRDNGNRSYYDDCYTNLYVYTGNPFYWGTSIYYGYGWYPYGYYGWGPSWRLSFGWGWGSWGFGYDPFWGYSWYPWGVYDPFWPYYGGYWCGSSWGWQHHHHGYWDYPHWDNRPGLGGGNAGFTNRIAPNQTTRGTQGLSTGSLGNRANTNQIQLGGSTSRRGGVDINNTAMGRGNNTLGSRSSLSTGSLSRSTGRNISGSHYSKPATVANSRATSRAVSRSNHAGNNNGHRSTGTSRSTVANSSWHNSTATSRNTGGIDRHNRTINANNASRANNSYRNNNSSINHRSNSPNRNYNSNRSNAPSSRSSINSSPNRSSSFGSSRSSSPSRSSGGFSSSRSSSPSRSSGTSSRSGGGRR